MMGSAAPTTPARAWVQPRNHVQGKVFGAFPSAESFRTCSAPGRALFPSWRLRGAVGAHPSPAPLGRAPTTQPGCGDSAWVGDPAPQHPAPLGRGEVFANLPAAGCARVGELPAPRARPPAPCTHLPSTARGGRATAGAAAGPAPSRGRGTGYSLRTDGQMDVQNLPRRRPSAPAKQPTPVGPGS